MPEIKYNYLKFGFKHILIFILHLFLFSSEGFSQNNAVIINGTTLSTQQLEDISKLYGVRPLPGSYWYDKISGLYGVKGYAAYGFMYPGHELGEISLKDSSGNTRVIVNGRELPQSEWMVWSSILGYYIQPGNYWFDANGNAGYVGSPIPLVNFYMIAKQNAYRKTNNKASGDNFWSSRFSAGNSDSGNTRGYISVPGYGPVGYGF